MIQDEFSPIQLEIKRISKRLDSACGSSYQTCTWCGGKGKGFSDLMEGTFTCIKCQMRKEIDRLDNDPEWIRKERVWNLRKAISDRKMQQGINTKIAEVQHDKEERY